MESREIQSYRLEAFNVLIEDIFNDSEIPGTRKSQTDSHIIRSENARFKST